jgi:DNA-directed RNA polymerase subunit RPC12/RpoP
MSELHTHTHKVVQVEQRCYECGRWWSCEEDRNWESQKRCPHCAGRIIKSLQKDIESMGRSNAALRGALKRRKGKR